MTLLRIIYYFRLTGVVSIVAWLAGLLMLARNWRHPERTRLYWTAFALSAFALMSANRNLENMAMIGLDQSAELQAQEKRSQEEPDDGKAAQSNDVDAVAEGTATGGVVIVESEKAPEVPLYRQEGKVEREDGKKLGDKTIAQAAEVEEEEELASRTLTAIHLFRANHYARMYTALARLLFWGALIFCLVDYLAKFNSTFGAYCILPIACRFVDSFCRKSHSVLIRNASKEAVIHYLERCVRKGESFIYYGPNDPWASVQGEDPAGIQPTEAEFPLGKRRRPDDAVPALARLPIPDPRPWLLDAAIVGLRRIEVQHLERWEQVRTQLPPRAWRTLLTPRLNATGLNESIHANFLLESTWFGRQCLVVEGADAARQWMAELQKFLRTRVHVLARVRRTVNIVWHVDVPISEEDLKELLFLCEETNYKLLLVGPHVMSAELAGRIEETYDEMPQP
jgi:hypothetical protein